MVRVIESDAKTLYTRSRIPGVDWVVNQYVGCAFACRYCYARFLCRWKPYGDWGEWVEVKRNAPELAARHVRGEVVMSTVSDPYQPFEARLKLTRRVLERMDRRNRLSILTKSPLVTRDVDVLKRFPSVEVGLTLNTFEGREKRLIEPLTPTLKARLSALKLLHEEGIETYAFVSPIIPGITDVEGLVRESRDFVGSYFFEVLNLKAAGRAFRELLVEHFPESHATLTDDEKFWRFLGELRETIRRLGVKSEGIEVHRGGWGMVEV